MKAGATICAIVFALLCSAPAADTAESSGGAIRPASSEAPVSQQHIETVTISPEAQACFDWFSKLGYPDLKDAPWIDVSTQPVNPPASFASQPPFRMVGYLISDTGNEFRFLAPDLEQVTREKSEPEANPQSRSWYEERPFFDMAKARLAELQGPPDADRERRSVYGRVDPMSQVFFLAYVCWQKGDAALAQELFNEAAKMSLVERERNGSKAGTATIQVSLERDFGKAAFIDAAFRFEGSPASLLGRVSVQEPAPRADLLKTFRQFPALYPASPYVKQAEGMAAILEKMVAEDALYKTLPAEELAKLPVEKQVDELIFLLRDQRGVWLFQSFDNIPFLSGEGSPAARLIAIGYPAVPKLIASLGDQRFSRVTREHGSPMGGFGAGTLDLSRPIASVGNCAEAILDDIAGRHFRGRYPETASITPKAIWEDKKLDAVRDAIESWWRDFQANGEKKTLIDALSSGKAPPQPLVQKLKAKFPDSVSDAVIRGAANAEEEWITREFIDELAALKSKPAAEQLRKMTTGNKSESIRIKGPGALLAQDDPAAISAAIREWRRLPLSGGFSPFDDSYGPLQLFIASGKTSAMREVVARWDGRHVLSRFAILQAIAERLREQADGNSIPDAKPMEKDARALAITLLVHALGDTFNCFGSLDSAASQSEGSPRICDAALLALHRVAPGVYPFSPKAGRGQRDMERINAANVWRREHSLAEIPLPPASAPKPKLTPADALRIVEIHLVFPQSKPEKEFAIFADSRHQRSNLARILSWERPVQKTNGISMEFWLGPERLISHPGPERTLGDTIANLKETEFTADTIPNLLMWFARNKMAGCAVVIVEARRDADLTGVQLNLEIEPGAPPANGEWENLSAGQFGGTALEQPGRVTKVALSETPSLLDDFSTAVAKGLKLPAMTEFIVSAGIVGSP